MRKAKPSKYVKQVANLMINEGRRMAKQYRRPLPELITDAEISLIATLIVNGTITKATGRKLFCDRCGANAAQE